MLAAADRFLALPRVRRILAMPSVHRDVYDCGMRFLHCRSKFLQIFWIGGREDRTPRLDLRHVEFLCHVRRKIFQLHLLRYWNLAGTLAIPALPSHDEFTKWIRRYRHSFSRIGGKLNRRPGTRRVCQTWQKPCSRRRTRTLPDKLSTCSRAHARKCNRDGRVIAGASGTNFYSARVRHSKLVSSEMIPSTPDLAKRRMSAEALIVHTRIFFPAPLSWAISAGFTSFL